MCWLFPCIPVLGIFIFTKKEKRVLPDENFRFDIGIPLDESIKHYWESLIWSKLHSYMKSSRSEVGYVNLKAI